MSVFDQRQRADDRPRMKGEKLYAFYDRASRLPFAVFRDLVNNWVDNLQTTDKAELIARMRNGDDLGFASSLSELLLHAAIHRLGLVLETHPEIPGTANKVDFLIRRPDGDRLAYLEVTTINPSAEVVARNQREAILFETLNSATLPGDLRLSYEVQEFGKTSPSAKWLKAKVERWAAQCADEARRRGEIRQIFEVDDWRFDLSLISGFAPRPGGRQIAFHGLIGGRFVGKVPSVEGLKKALNAKAKRYGTLDLPYIIAVFDRTDSLAWLADEFPNSVSDVLFGAEGHKAIVMRSGDIIEVDRRGQDGWFGTLEKPRHQGVSAVLVFPSAEPWYLSEQRGQPLLVRHPWAEGHLPDGIFPVNEFLLGQGEDHIVAGRMMSDLLELPRPWPPEE